MPDAIATYQWRGETYLVMANEGDFREDNADRSAASTFGAVAPLDRLRVSNRDSSPGNLFAAGARSFSIRRTDGTLVYDSGSILDRAGARPLDLRRQPQPRQGRRTRRRRPSRIGDRTYAFIGLERTTSSSVAIFDVTDPNDVAFVDLIVTPGSLSPEGLAAYRYRGQHYLAIANEVVASGATVTTTTLYHFALRRGHQGADEDDD